MEALTEVAVAPTIIVTQKAKEIMIIMITAKGRKRPSAGVGNPIVMGIKRRGVMTVLVETSKSISCWFPTNFVSRFVIMAGSTSITRDRRVTMPVPVPAEVINIFLAWSMVGRIFSEEISWTWVHIFFNDSIIYFKSV